jgi:hypothetical protein
MPAALANNSIFCYLSNWNPDYSFHLFRSHKKYLLTKTLKKYAKKVLNLSTPFYQPIKFKKLLKYYFN